VIQLAARPSGSNHPDPKQEKPIMSKHRNKSHFEDKQRRNSKKSAVLGSDKRRFGGPLIAVAAAALAAAGGFVLIAAMNNDRSTPLHMAASAPGIAEQVTYPVSLFEDGKARHFEHAADGITVRYFILRSSDGIIRAAFDACDVCWPANKGYYQDGDAMVCRNCGRRFASVMINEVQGGCNPAPLNRSIEDDKLVIAVNDILQGRTYFDFKGRG
jgi:uncharacterized membrane protein